MSRERLGVAYGAAAYGLWGLFPLYWPLLQPAGALEILAHRVSWSLLFVALLLLASRRRGWLRRLFARPVALGVLVAAALVISVNWGTYIWGVTNGHIVETSLGYYINPLVTVVLGVLLLGERLRRAQWAAVSLAAVAVAVLTADYGRPPWIALTLAFSFGTYGLLKKQADAGAVEGLTVETAVLVLPALGYLGWLESAGQAAFGHAGALNVALLVLAGAVTAIPLLLFGAAATRVPLVTLGLLQYLAPTFQLLIGVLIFDEPLPPVRLAGFILVWAALALLTVEALAHQRRALRRSSEAVAV